MKNFLYGLGITSNEIMMQEDSTGDQSYELIPLPDEDIVAGSLEDAKADYGTPYPGAESGLRLYRTMPFQPLAEAAYKGWATACMLGLNHLESSEKANDYLQTMRQGLQVIDSCGDAYEHLGPLLESIDMKLAAYQHLLDHFDDLKMFIDFIDEQMEAALGSGHYKSLISVGLQMGLEAAMVDTDDAMRYVEIHNTVADRYRQMLPDESAPHKVILLGQSRFEIMASSLESVKDVDVPAHMAELERMKQEHASAMDNYVRSCLSDHPQQSYDPETARQKLEEFLQAGENLRHDKQRLQTAVQKMEKASRFNIRISTVRR
ncbi:hypothetical protein GF351_03770 [Candidatus Woesearchaeota archaeon]|nr:hypothetical protein [Candidatus Woesearchaeota archaeon]